MKYRNDIQFLVDGELLGDDRAELDRHLESCPECRLLLQELEAESFRIRAARPNITAPDSLRSVILQRVNQANRSEQEKTEPVKDLALPIALGKPARRLPRAALTIAATILLMAGGAFLYMHGNQPNANALVQESLIAHQALQSNAMPLDISSSSSQQVIDYFQHKISFPLRYANSGIASEDLAKYKLTGGRLISVSNERAVLLSFTLGNEYITMIVVPDDIPVPAVGREFHSDGITFHSQEYASLHVVTWKNRGLGYALTSTRAMTSTGKCTTCHAEHPLSDVSIKNNPFRWLSLSSDPM